MSRANDAVYPIGSGDERDGAGLTIREHFAAMAMQGLMGRAWQDGNQSGEKIIAQWARSAVICADALISELAKAKP